MTAKLMGRRVGAVSLTNRPGGEARTAIGRARRTGRAIGGTNHDDIGNRAHIVADATATASAGAGTARGAEGTYKIIKWEQQIVIRAKMAHILVYRIHQ